VGGLRGVRRFVLSLGLVFALEEGLCGNDKHVACREKEVARELFITHSQQRHTQMKQGKIAQRQAHSQLYSIYVPCMYHACALKLDASAKSTPLPHVYFKF